MLRVVLAILLVVVLGAAQALEEQTITVDVDLVNVYFSVCNSKGRLIADLGKENFSVLEDNELQTITHFSREADVPLAIVLLIDASGSVWDKLSFEQQAATEFVHTTLRPGRDKAALYTFDYVSELQQDYTDDPALLTAAIRRIHAGGGTRLYDALHSVLQDKFSRADERQVIVVITDGEDKSSRRSPEEVIDLAHRNNVSIYAINVSALGIRKNESGSGDDVLQMLALETGGKSFFPKKPEKLSSYFKSISNELRSQYTIAYRSTNLKRDGSFRRVRIDVKKVQYAVRARAGYYAPAQVTAQKN